MKPYDIAYIICRFFSIYLLWKFVVLAGEYTYVSMLGAAFWYHALLTFIYFISCVFFYTNADWVAKKLIPKNQEDGEQTFEASHIQTIGIALIGVYIFSTALTTLSFNVMAMSQQESFIDVLHDRSREQLIDIAFSLFLILGANWISKLITKFRNW